MNRLCKRHRDLYVRMVEQVGLLQAALRGNDNGDLLEHIEAMARGCEQARQAMLVDRVKELWPGAEVIAVREKDQLAPGE